MHTQEGFYLGRKCTHAVDFDHFLGPSQVRQRAHFVETPCVSGAKPPIDQRVGGSSRIAPIPCQNRWGIHQNFAFLSYRDRVEVLIDNHDVCAWHGITAVDGLSSQVPVVILQTQREGVRSVGFCHPVGRLSQGQRSEEHTSELQSRGHL